MDRKYKGLKAAVGLIKSIGKGLANNGHYVQIGYNPDTDEVLASYFVSLGRNSWTQYSNPNTICIGNYWGRNTTMATLKQDIENTIELRRNEHWD